jgi:hypothetical protein
VYGICVFALTGPGPVSHVETVVPIFWTGLFFSQNLITRAIANVNQYQASAINGNITQNCLAFLPKHLPMKCLSRGYLKAWQTKSRLDRGFQRKQYRTRHI